MMNNRSGAWLTSEESLQTVIDIVPSVVGLGRNSDQQDESQYRRQADAQQIPSIKTHCSSSSSVFSATLRKRIAVVSLKISEAPWPFEIFRLRPPDPIKELRQSNGGFGQLLASHGRILLFIIRRQGDRDPKRAWVAHGFK